ncbi:uncharacterized protein N7503_009380 [Penicillium pulvis]|uniref:uncharacterized protein n=1 Tax=Penicillium pulvis TaxID=1562058 RepID=UPI0025470EE1|nr:uncharacterized protein N7503_009380 [Penicillium pulvis]KAJ5793402.1 hypothetical protein N7503_009380 [Penicillium pulvis]
MPPNPRDEGDLLAKPNRLALLSRNLGFQSPKINEILANDPDIQIARNALLKARDPFHYVYNAPPLHVLIGNIAENFKIAS